MEHTDRSLNPRQTAVVVKGRIKGAADALGDLSDRLIFMRYLFLLLMLSSIGLSQTPPIGPGVSQDLAKWRAEHYFRRALQAEPHAREDVAGAERDDRDTGPGVRTTRGNGWVERGADHIDWRKIVCVLILFAGSTWSQTDKKEILFARVKVEKKAKLDPYYAQREESFQKVTYEILNVIDGKNPGLEIEVAHHEFAKGIKAGQIFCAEFKPNPITREIAGIALEAFGIVAEDEYLVDFDFVKERPCPGQFQG